MKNHQHKGRFTQENHIRFNAKLLQGSDFHCFLTELELKGFVDLLNPLDRQNILKQFQVRSSKMCCVPYVVSVLKLVKEC